MMHNVKKGKKGQGTKGKRGKGKRGQARKIKKICRDAITI